LNSNGLTTTNDLYHNSKMSLPAANIERQQQPGGIGTTDIVSNISHPTTSQMLCIAQKSAPPPTMDMVENSLQESSQQSSNGIETNPFGNQPIQHNSLRGPFNTFEDESYPASQNRYRVHNGQYKNPFD